VIAPCEKGGTALTVLLEEHFANVRRSHEILFSLLQQLQQQGGSTFPTRWSGKFQSDPGYRRERTGGALDSQVRRSATREFSHTSRRVSTRGSYSEADSVCSIPE
jgi:hypothetical protein